MRSRSGMVEARTNRQTGTVNMPNLVTGTVRISPETEQAFRQRMGKDYGEIIPDISQAPLALLIRFLVLISIDIPANEAKRVLKSLPRGVNKRDHITV